MIPPYYMPLLLLLGAWLLRPSQSADPRKPHPHKGVLEVCMQYSGSGMR